MSKRSLVEKEGLDGNASKQQKIALPTRDEQKQLQQVELLMKSSLLQLQVDQILEEVDSSPIANKKRVVTWMDEVVNILKDTSKYGKSVGATLNKKIIKKLGLKGVDLLNLVNGDDSSIQLNFQPPAAVDVVGSTVHQSAISAMFNIDVAVTMPPSLFDSKDVLNHRYFDKRRMYLVGLYQHLLGHHSANTPLFSAVSVAAFKGDLRKPILELQAPFTVARASGGVTLRLIPVIAESGVFRAVQLKAGKNNVRPHHHNTGEGSAEEGDSSLPATPLYNLAVLEDMAVLTQHRILSRTVSTSPALSKALVLLKIWLTQRGLRFAADGFDGHCAGLLLAYLLLTRRVSNSAATTPLSAFQTALTFIAEGHLLQCDLDFRSAELGPRRPPSQLHASLSTGAGSAGLRSNGGAVVMEDSAVSLSADLKHSSVLDEHTWDYKRPLCLVHPLGPQTGGPESGRYNCLWRVSASAADTLQREARRSLRELQQQEAGCFTHLFMQKRSFFERHDHFYHFKIEGRALPYLENSSIHVPKAEAEDSVSMRALSEVPAAVRKELRNMLLHCPAPDHFAAAAVQLVARGLGDRATAVHSHVRCVEVDKKSADSAEEAAMEVSAHRPAQSVAEVDESGAVKTVAGDGAEKRDWVVSLGVVLDVEKQDRRVERGPVPSETSIPDIAADPAQAGTAELGDRGTDDELRRFRAFWGPKVQLRRFKDGAIMESVVWDTPSTGGEGGNAVPVVVEQVVKYVLGRHLPAVCGDAGALVQGANTQVERALGSTQGASDDSLSRRAVEALDKLRGVLTSQLKKLPLGFEALMPMAPELRYTAAVPPVPHPLLVAAMESGEGTGKGLKRVLKQYAGRSLSLLAPPMRVLVQLESSGKWPLEARAVAMSKLAMLLRASAELKSQFQVLSFVHKEGCCLDVCFEGFVFRLQLVGTPEVEAVQMAVSRGLRDASAEVVQLAVARAVAVPPLHHLAVRALRAQFPSYSGAVRLLAAWAAQHYFSGHLCLEMLELVVAYEYLHPFTASAPASPLAGFYRALLRLGDHNWDADPLVVDLSGESREISGNSAVQERIQAQFRTAREGLKEGEEENGLSVHFRRRMNAAMYVVSSADKVHGYWPALAEKSPERVVLGLVVRAAKVSAQRLLGWMQGCGNADGDEQAAIAEVMGDDAVLGKCQYVLRFNKSLVNKQPQEGPAFASLSVFANTPSAEAAPTALVVREAECALHPVQEGLVQQLRERFGDSALFFWNSRSGKEVGLIWRPRLLQPSSFAVLTARDRAVVSEDGESNISTTEANLPQLLSAMLDLAGGLLVQAEEVSKE